MAIISLVAYFLRFKGIVCFTTGVIIAGLPITISSSNSGSAWDNAKKLVELEVQDEKYIKESENYFLLKSTKHIKDLRKNSIKNAVIADNVGDAFKDIAGPAINILIKFTSFLSLIIVNYLVIY